MRDFRPPQAAGGTHGQRCFGILKIAVLLGVLALSLRGWRPTQGAHAQDSIVFEALTIELWPEYDQPTMLVILHITLAPATQLPATLTLHVPAAAKGPSAVAVQDPNGQLLTAAYTTALAGDTLAVQFDTNYRSVQLEYYDPALKLTGDTRDYNFSWQADYAASTLAFRVQEPVDAHNLSGEPPLSLAGASGSGLNYDTTAPRAISAGQAVSFHLRYTKATATLSKPAVDQIAAAPTAVMPAAANSPASGVALPPWLLLGALAVVAAGSGAWAAAHFWRQRRQSSTQGRRAPAPLADSAARPEPITADRPERFCTGCGQPAMAEDRFCRRCGTPLRSGVGQADRP